MDQNLQLELAQLADTITSFTGNLVGVVDQVAVVTGVAEKDTIIKRAGINAQDSNTAAINKRTEADKKAADTVQNASTNIAEAFKGLWEASKTFYQTVLSSEAGFTKYGSTVNQLGKTSLKLGSSFNALGMAVGGSFFVLSKITEQAFKQADGILKGVDSLSNMGAVGQVTSKDLYDMAHNAGLTSQNIEVFTKATDHARTSLIALGGNTGNGIKQLAKMFAVSAEQRQAFQRLGVSQEQLMDRMADYVELQTQSGLILDKNAVETGVAQKHALEYAETITMISTITNRNAEEAKKGMLKAKANFDIQIHQARLQAELDDPKTKIERQNEIRKRLAIEDQLLNTAEQTHDAEYLTAVQSKLATGMYTNASVTLLRRNIDLDKILKDQMNRSYESIEAEKGIGEARAQLMDQQVQGYKRNLQNMGTAATFNEGVAKQYGFNQQYIESSTENLNKSLDDFRAQGNIARKLIEDNKNKKGPVATDPAQQARNKMTQMQIDAGQVVDDLVASMNPLLGNTGMFALFATTATVITAAFTTIIASRATKAGKQFISSLFGKNIPTAEKAEIAEEAAMVSENVLPEKLMGRKSKEQVNASPKQGFAESLKSIAGALSDAGKAAPQVILGAGVLATAIAEFGAGIAGAVYIIGASLPSLSKGLKSFNEINGENLKQAGIGMAGLGVGILAMGAGAMSNAMGTIVRFFTGDKDPLTQVSELLNRLQKMNLDRKKIEDNGASLMAYAKAMAAISALGAGRAIADAVKGVYGSISKLFGAKPPYKDLENFSRLKIDSKAVKTNADSFVYFAKAMASFKGTGSFEDTISTIAGAAIGRLFSIDGPLDSFKKFAAIDIGPKVTENTQAFLNFSKAMGILSADSGNLGKALTGLANGAAAIAGGVVGATAGAIGSAGSWLGKMGSGAFNAVAGAFGSFGNWIMDTIAGHEGVRTRPYKDSLGLWTVGVGHLIGDGHSLPPQYNREFSKDEVKAMFQQDYTRHAQAASGIPGFNRLNERGKGALIDMTFNLGPAWYRKWPNFTRALDAGDLHGAANQLEGSKWAKQVGRRAQEDIAMIRDGAMKAKVGGLFEGPHDGYPIELHGTELVIPLDSNSILTKIASTSEDAVINELQHNVTKSVSKPNPNYTTTPTTKNKGLTTEMVRSMAHKFDRVIGKIESTNHVQQKLLKHAY